MKRTIKMMAAGLIATSLVAPTVSFATSANLENNENININLEKTTVVLGDTSKISIKFKENLNADSITINFLCYDMPLSANLKFNPETNSYEGIIEFNKDPEYLNVWQIENITINGENKQILDKQKLEELGLNLQEYNIVQEYIITNKKYFSSYVEKTSAPVKKLIGDNRSHTAAKISQEGWKDGADKVILVNGNAIADGITATPLATTMNAPILLTNNGGIPQNTKDELARLNPKDIIIIGGESVVSNNVENELKTITASNVLRIAGKNRYETSLKIAKEIDDYHDVEKIFIANGYQGEVDALTIAAKAGEDKQPIILSEKTKLPEITYNWLKNENLKNAYFIGGENNLTTDVIHQVAGITTPASGQSVYNNRVYGKDRYETNAKVMAKFYPNEKLNSVLVAKGDILVDALTAGPLAAKQGSPILITKTDSIPSYHNTNLSNKTADVVYQVGGGVKDGVIGDIAYKLSLHNSGTKTVVLDPGHGGSDTGAPNKVDKSIVEKNYTLDVSLATADYLRKNNVNVVMTRDKDVTMSLRERTDLSNRVKPNLFTSIHFNSFNGEANGLEVYYKNKDKNGGPTKTLANNIYNSILEKFNLTKRGLKTRTLEDGRDYLHVLRETDADSVLVECSFIDSPKDQQLVDELHERQLMGTQIGKGIEKTLN
ncbi:cell wall-binding repeat-containing protein [Clostridium sp. CCUG 7971]|uniref:cell wall-binding repeat-containing protein n=1 Tax=Clostridium sp. CCUG 7971 TaxID=2811414 RepID=UPI001ABB5B35|nr:cell wall-binding repeat-containing protein [Clostridium sp. CCUG 7971]MBO3443036.1 cell wall-binding repeat-containing protein [Clostridium sp. CCUG 7971]